jgi:TolA-binding protein
MSRRFGLAKLVSRPVLRRRPAEVESRPPADAGRHGGRSVNPAALIACVVLALAAPLAAQAPGSPDDVARRQYQSGLDFMRAGKFAEALKDFQTVVDSYPSSPVADDAQLGIARYQLDVLRDGAAAQAAAEALLKKFPSGDMVPAAYVIAGRAILAQGMTAANIDAALADFARVPRLFPGNPAVGPAVFHAGDTLRRLGRCAEAAERFDRVVTEYPRTVWAARARVSGAACLIGDARPYDAMEMLQQVVTALPGSPEAAEARAWNTILQRLYVRALSRPAYSLAARTVAGAGGKLRDVTALRIADRSLVVASRNGVLVFDEKDNPVRSAAAGDTRAVAVDDQGRLVIVQKALVQQQEPGSPAPKLLTLTGPRPEAGQARVLDDLSAVAILSTGERLIADRGLRTVGRFDAAGKYLGAFATARAARLAVGPADMVALLDRDTKTISVLDRTGKPLWKVAGKTGEYDLQSPQDIAFDPLGHLYVLDAASILVFAPAGQLVTVSPLGDRGAPAAIRNASAFAIDPYARLFVYDDRAERIQVLQ